MEKFLAKIQPKHYGIVAAVLSALGMYMILSTCQYLSTGKFIILGADHLQQYVPYAKMFMRDILEGESIWYSWNTSMGMNTSLVNAYYVLSPFNLLYLIFWPVEEYLVATAIILLKISLCAYTFHVFLNRVMKIDGVESILFSIMYALSTYMVLYGYLFNSWLEGAYMLPLILTLIYELKDVKSHIKLTFAYAFLFVSQFYFAYMVGIFSFVFWLALMILGDKTSVSDIVKKVVKYFGSVLLAIGISAVFIVPTLYFLITNMAPDATTFDELSTHFYDLFFAMFWGNRIPQDNNIPALYCGMLVVLLLPFYFANKEIKNKEKIMYGGLIFGVGITMLINPLYQLMHAFDSPDLFNFRHAFLLVFLLCVVACRQFKYIDKMNIYIVAIIAGIYSILFFVLDSVCDFDHNFKIMRLVINIVVLVAWIGVWILKRKVKNNAMMISILAIIILLIELCGNGWYAINDPAADREDSYTVWKEEITAAVEEFSEDESFYRSNIDGSVVVNSDSWFGYNGLADFCSAEDYYVRQACRFLGMSTTTRKTDNFGATPPVEMLLGVKYHVDLPSPFLSYETVGNYNIKENPYYLQIGFMVEEELENYYFPSYDSFENINSILSTMSGDEVECFVPFDNNVLVTCEQAEIEPTEDMIIISYDPEKDQYGMVTYYIPKETVTSPIYMQFIHDISLEDPDSPFIVGGKENLVRQKGLLTVPYIKEMVEEEDRYAVTIVMNDNTMSNWYYYAAVFYEYHEDALKKVYDNLSQAQLEVTEYADGYVKGHVNVSEDKTLLFTTIPYDEGWTVSVDGKEVETIAVVESAFLAIQLEPGYHEIEFEYHVPGLKEGMILSGISLGIVLMFILTGFMSKKKKNI